MCTHRSLVLLGVVCLATFAVTGADRAPVFIDMGASVHVVALNNHAGEMAYDTYAGTGIRAVFSNNGVETLISPLPGDSESLILALNDRGQVLLSSYSNGFCTRAFIWDRGVSTQVGGCDTHVIAMNDRAQVIGYTNDPLQGWRASLWDNGARIDLGPTETVSAWAINDRSQIVGTRGSKAFLWENGKFTDLPSLPDATTCGARDINHQGVIVGWCRINNLQSVVVWEHGKPKQMPQPAGSIYNIAQSINSHGVLTGRSVINGLPQAVVWDGDQVTVLADVLGRPDWRLETGIRVTDHGMLSGYGYLIASPGVRVFLVNMNAHP